MKNRRLGLLAALALCLVWAVSPQGVPLYDGIGEPEQSYRYASPPAGADPVAPGRLVRTVDAGGLNKTLDIDGRTDDLQLQLSFPPGNFLVSGASTFVMTGTAYAPDRPPAGVSFNGNSYRLAAELRPGVTVKWKPPVADKAGLVLIRTTVTERGTMYFRATPTAAWQPLTSERFGNHSTAGVMMGLGDYAVGFPGEGRFTTVDTAADPATGQSSSSLKLPQILGGLAIVMVLVLIGVRLARRQRPARRPGH